MRSNILDCYYIDPCPFCGNTENFEIIDRSSQSAQLECSDCNASGPEESKNECGLIVQAWNDRGDEKRITKQIEDISRSHNEFKKRNDEQWNDAILKAKLKGIELSNEIFKSLNLDSEGKNNE